MKPASDRRRLTRDDWRAIGAVFVAQVVLGAAVRVRPVRSISRAVPAFRGVARRIIAAPDARIAWAIEAVGRRVPGISTCLVRALAADLFLSAPGRAGQVRIGVKRSSVGQLQSHAWFEREGHILVGGSGAADYVDFVTLA